MGTRLENGDAGSVEGHDRPTDKGTVGANGSYHSAAALPAATTSGSQASSTPGTLQPATSVKPSLRVVAIGGGTGLSTLLRGFKHFVASPAAAGSVKPDRPVNGQPLEERAEASCLISDLAAVVTVTDDGGSSGRLRKDFNMLPPGDLRNCMVALSEDEHLLSQLFRHRFRTGGEGLEGHSFGNLFVAALSEITGDFAQAIKLASQVLATRGRLYPATTSNVVLSALMADGSTVRGETNITASRQRIERLSLDPAHAEPIPETLEAISRADLITMGPGSLFTSLITNLLVSGIPEALAKAKGVRVYVANMMTQANESLDLTASQHIERIYDHAGRAIFDYALVNTAPVSGDLLERYAAQGARPIEADVARIEALGVGCITGNFAAEGDVLRHNADRVAETVLGLGLKNLERAKTKLAGGR